MISHISRACQRETWRMLWWCGCVFSLFGALLCHAWVCIPNREECSRRRRGHVDSKFASENAHWNPPNIWVLITVLRSKRISTPHSNGWSWKNYADLRGVRRRGGRMQGEIILVLFVFPGLKSEKINMLTQNGNWDWKTSFLCRYGSLVWAGPCWFLGCCAVFVLDILITYGAVCTKASCSVSGMDCRNCSSRQIWDCTRLCFGRKKTARCMKILLVCSSIFALLESQAVNLKDSKTHTPNCSVFLGRPARYEQP